MKQNTNIEILAPAGSYEAVCAAVACRADAVYLGGKDFNARRNAENHEEKTLAETVAFCHAHKVKVYYTLNILLYDNELPQLIETIINAANAGVDAFIIQDMAVLRVAKQVAPHISCHASTQTVIHNAHGLKAAKSIGYERAVLARELTKNEIEIITKSGYAETEVFLHGALCMCVSGQCYLSSVIGERSGNRGLCAQPCRLPFKTSFSENALSLKDLSIIEEIKQLEDIGVTSAKIEGRMKRPEYVAAAVTAAYEARENRKVDMKSLQSVFSRSGFTKGYFINKIDRDMFGVRKKEDVVAASSVLTQLAQLYQKPIGKIKVDMHLTLIANEASHLVVTDKDGASYSAYGDIPELAQNKPLDKERVSTYLQKTGGTPFIADNISATLDDNITIAASKLNAVRREALQGLEDIYREVKPFELGKYKAVKSTLTPPKSYNIRIRANTLSQLSDEMLAESEAVILPINSDGLEGTRGISDKIWIELPPVDFNTELTKKRVEKLLALGYEHFVVGNLGAIELCKELNVPFLHGSHELNIFNSEALFAYGEMGLCDAEVSFELPLAQIKKLTRTMKIGIKGYGHLPLMSFRNCPIKAAKGCKHCTGHEKIIDRKNTEFFIGCKNNVPTLYNALPLYLGDRAQELIGLDFIMLEFTNESKAQAQNAWDLFKAQSAFENKFTRGLYFRKVK